MEKDTKKLINITDSKKEPSKEFLKRKPSVIFKNSQRIKKQFEKAFELKKLEDRMSKMKRFGREGLEVEKIRPRVIKLRDKYEFYGWAVIRDINRLDSYPDDEKTANNLGSWFEAWVERLSFGGLEIVSLPPKGSMVRDEMENQFRRAKIEDKNQMSIFDGGVILFDDIIDVDWKSNDSFDSCFRRGPHVYCDFKNGKFLNSPKLYTHDDNDKDENMKFITIKEKDEKRGLYVIQL